MNCSQRRNGVVRGLLLSLILIAMPSFVGAQKKNAAPAPAPSKPAPPPPKPAAVPKPAAAPKPVEAPKHEAKPATAATGGATRSGTTTAHTGTTSGARPNMPSMAHPGNTNGLRNGSTMGTRTNGPAPAPRAEVEREYRPPVVVTHPGGGKSVTNAAGHSAEYNPAGKKISLETKGGTKANFDRNGYIKTIHTSSGTVINHGAHGERRYESRRADGGRIVGFGHGRGFAERAYYRGGHSYMRRTYFTNGQRYAYAYRGYYWHGHHYYGYVPPYYYASPYYGWAITPWGAQITYGWGWGGAPWYGYYGYYFAPAPVYDSASLWLTDYLLAANLQAAYEARAQANAAASYQDAAADGQATVTPEMKQQIADEVRAEIAAEKAEEEAAPANPEPGAPVNDSPPPAAQNGPDEAPAALDPSAKTFLVSTVLSESMTDGTECSLSPGDILTRVQDTPDNNQAVKVVVASSQRNDCAAGTQLVFAVVDLQDMHNDFRAKISEGLGQLAKNQGKNGIPAGPPPAAKPNPLGQLQPDQTVEADLKAQQNEVAQAESDIQQASVVAPGSD